MTWTTKVYGYNGDEEGKISTINISNATGVNMTIRNLRLAFRAMKTMHADVLFKNL
jgi:hypothetical protein